MSAYSHLMTHDGPEPVRERQLPESRMPLGANYQVPILWLTLFSAADFQHISLPPSESEDGESPELIPTLFAKTSDALRNYARHKDAIRKALADHIEQIDEWESFIAAHLTTEFVQIDFEDFYGVLDDFDAELSSWMDGLGRLEGSGWESLCEQACLHDRQTARLGMRGFPLGLDNGWEE